MGGATNIAKHVRRCGASGAGLDLFGLCDAGQAALFTRVLDAEAVFVCRDDLEEELPVARTRAAAAALLDHV